MTEEQLERISPDEIINRLEDNETEFYSIDPSVFVHVDNIDEKLRPRCLHKQPAVTYGQPLPEGCDLKDKSCFFEDQYRLSIDSKHVFADKNGIWWVGDTLPTDNISMNVVYVILYAGLEDALIGTSESWVGNQRPTRAVYSGARILDIYMQRDGMDFMDALEMLTVNTDGGYLGLYTPIVVYDF